MLDSLKVSIPEKKQQQKTNKKSLSMIDAVLLCVYRKATNLLSHHLVEEVKSTWKYIKMTPILASHWGHRSVTHSPVFLFLLFPKYCSTFLSFFLSVCLLANILCPAVSVLKIYPTQIGCQLVSDPRSTSWKVPEFVASITKWSKRFSVVPFTNNLSSLTLLLLSSRTAGLSKMLRPR